MHFLSPVHYRTQPRVLAGIVDHLEGGIRSEGGPRHSGHRLDGHFHKPGILPGPYAAFQTELEYQGRKETYTIGQGGRHKIFCPWTPIPSETHLFGSIPMGNPLYFYSALMGSGTWTTLCLHAKGSARFWDPWRKGKNMIPWTTDRSEE